ncbi:uncharacterized protein LOC144467610 [Augochlora pura]
MDNEGKDCDGENDRNSFLQKFGHTQAADVRMRQLQFRSAVFRQSISDFFKTVVCVATTIDIVCVKIFVHTGTLQTLRERNETTDRTFELQTTELRRAFTSLGVNTVSDGAAITEDDDADDLEGRPSAPVSRNRQAAQQEQNLLSRANEILRTIKVLRGKDDMGVEEFIKQITENAERSIRYHNIDTYDQLYQALRTQDIEPISLTNAKAYTGTRVKQFAKTQPHTRMALISAKDSSHCPICKGKHFIQSSRIIILDGNNREHQCRVLLDPGSQSNFITESLTKKLGLKLHGVNMPVTGLGETSSTIRHCARTSIRSRIGNFSENVSLLVLPTITGRLPSRQVDRAGISIPHNIKLADPEFDKPAAIEALLGEYLFYKLLCVGQIRLANKTCILQKTRLGWVISGEIKCQQHATSGTRAYLAKHELEEQVANFWEIEECPIERHFSAEEEASEQSFRDNTYRNERESAELKQQYQDFIKEYLELGHMSLVKQDRVEEGFYLPHHAVLKTTSSTTKLRVVFDASAKSSNGVSLNDTLLVGSTIQDDIFQLIIRFRTYNYVLTADIEKMFRQVRIHPEHSRYQKILWRDSTKETVQTYQLDTVTYGTAPAPFLAVRTLIQLAEDEGQAFPSAAHALQHDFYVDDLITGADTVSQAAQLRDELTKLLSLGGFNLRQWASNEESLVNSCNEQAKNDTVHFNATETKRTLGVCWNARLDTISYSVSMDATSQRITKRGMLSQIAKLFDPLGLLGPVIILAKILMQELWKSKLDWDESVPQSIHTAWTNYVQQLPCLNSFQIARKVLITQATCVQLHGFADASECGYGACIYFRSTDNKGRTISRLICAKSRVAPLKTVSLPRLELCAALLLAKLYRATISRLKLNFSKVRFWSDSIITLYWLRSSPHKLKTFVANRVSEIQGITGSTNWRHVPTKDNPADYISRGQMPEEFVSNVVWLYGPEWLVRSEDTWPEVLLPKIEIPEQRGNVSLISKVTLDETDVFYKFSSFSKLQRVLAYCLKFKEATLNKSGFNGYLSVADLNKAHDGIIKRTQGQAFPAELKQLGAGEPLDKGSRLIPLNPFLDKKGIIRVGGRLSNADIRYAQKHPIVLPRSHPVTTLIIRFEHLQTLHSGTQGTLNAVRQRYWPIDGKNMTRHIIRKCARCFKAKPTSPPDYLLGNLPRDRLVASRPFENSGVDYCGPLFVKEKRFRNQRRIKVYVAVFICFLTKAVHLELVSDLTTEAFLAALSRFFARRGAKNEIAELLKVIKSRQHNDQVSQHLANSSIVWHFSPPRSPHFGGLWEAAVKSFKHHLVRTVGDTLLTYEQLNTYITQVEGILNSRPLTPISSDPNDLQSLTPAHFLIAHQTALLDALAQGVPKLIECS